MGSTNAKHNISKPSKWVDGQSLHITVGDREERNLRPMSVQMDFDHN
jgi:hypothetical protein